MFSPAFKPDWPAAAELGRQLRFVDPVALMHLSRGLTFNPLRSAEVLDDVLVHFNETSGYVAEVETWVRAGGLQAGACPAYPGGRIIADVREAANAEGKTAHTAAILKEAREAGVAPAVFLSMVSPLLDVAMRVELPMRAILHGNPSLAGTYTLYLHTLLTARGRPMCITGSPSGAGTSVSTNTPTRQSRQRPNGFSRARSTR